MFWLFEKAIVEHCISYHLDYFWVLVICKSRIMWISTQQHLNEEANENVCHDDESCRIASTWIRGVGKVFFQDSGCSMFKGYVACESADFGCSILILENFYVLRPWHRQASWRV